jgi:hypothetical protein
MEVSKSSFKIFKSANFINTRRAGDQKCFPKFICKYVEVETLRLRLSVVQKIYLGTGFLYEHVGLAGHLTLVLASSTST